MILALSFLLMPEGLTEALDTYLSYSVKQLEPLDVIIKDLTALQVDIISLLFFFVEHIPLTNVCVVDGFCGQYSDG